MDKKKVIKYCIVLLMLSASGYYLYQHAVDVGLAKPALILKVSTNITEKGTPMVNNVTFEQSSVPFFYKRTDNVPDFPEVVANARINRLDAAPASFWAAAHYEGEGIYTLKVFFRDGREPKNGDVLILPIELKGITGVRQYKTTAFYLWE